MLISQAPCSALRHSPWERPGALMAAAPSVGLGSRLRQTTPSSVLLHNELSARDVWLADLLRQPGLPPLRLCPVLRNNPRIEKRLIVAGKRGVVAQVGLTADHLHALGVTATERPALLDAVAAQLLSPAMGGLRALCDDDLQLSVVDPGDGLPHGPDWVSIALLPPLPLKRLPACVSVGLATRMAERAACLPGVLRAAAPLPLVVGHRLHVPIAGLRSLGVGDVLLAGAADAHACAGVHIDSAGVAAGLVYLATVRLADGRIEHLNPGAWRPRGAAATTTTADGPQVQLDIVLARLTLPSDQCQSLALGDTLAEWPGVAPDGAGELRLAGHTIADIRRTRVAGRTGFEIERIRPLGNRVA